MSKFVSVNLEKVVIVKFDNSFLTLFLPLWVNFFEVDRRRGAYNITCPYYNVTIMGKGKGNKRKMIS